MIHSVMRVWTVHAAPSACCSTSRTPIPTLSFHHGRRGAGRADPDQPDLQRHGRGGGQWPGDGAAGGHPKDEALGVLVEITDTGPAVPAEDRERMFEAFDQTARGRLQASSGLGLKICAQNLALMGGEIGVDNRAGAASGQAPGAVFWFAFDAPVQAPPVAAPRPASPRAEPIRVLAAEDNPANRNVLAALLVAAPVSLVFAEDGAQALDAWRAQPFDLVLMDVNMPVLDGLAPWPRSAGPSRRACGFRSGC
jgi:hypothetical protein